MRLPIACVSILAGMAQFVSAEPVAVKDGRDVLQKANEAASKLSAIAYKAEMYFDGTAGVQSPRLAGKVVARRNRQTRVDQVRIEATSTATPPAVNPASQPAPISEAQVFVSNGNDAFLLEEGRKVFTTGKPADAQTVPVASLFSTKFMSESAFAEELHAMTITHDGTQTVAGDECDIVTVRYDPTGTRTDRLFIGKKDGLLRRIEKGIMYRMPGRQEIFRGLLVFVASALDTTPKVEDKTFTLDCPPGFRKEAFRTDPQATGAVAPEWELKTPDDKTVKLKSLRGKVVVMDFWATWCGPCKMAMPMMQKLHERFKDKPVLVYGVNCWERNPGANPMEYIKSKNFTYPQLLSADQAARAYGVTGIPTIVAIGPDGKIIFRMSGYNPSAEESLAQSIENALHNESH